MVAKDFSFIIPVYNRPDEIEELLESFDVLKGERNFEIVIVEDGSNIPCDKIIERFKDILHISYYFKTNSGPGASRNYGMQKAKGSYFIILDSDCLLPENYLNEVIKSLDTEYVDCFGGPDKAHESFTTLQKSIDFSMTSFITTGGIRGGKKQVNKFQPRSFNMGLSRKAFESTNGFGLIHPGEDPDLSIRLWNAGFKTKLIPKAFVYHKRRISWKKFYKQVYKFGMARGILNKWHPQTKKITYWFPSLFSLGFVTAVAMMLFNFWLPIKIYLLYFGLTLLTAWFTTWNLGVSFMVIMAVLIQFMGYGFGFLKSTLKLAFTNKGAAAVLPQMFFKA